MPSGWGCSFTDGDGHAADPAQDWQWWDESFGREDALLFNGEEIINAGAGDDNIVASSGNDVINGGDGWDQVQFNIAFAELSIGIASDGSVQTRHAELGYDVYTGIEAAYSNVDGYLNWAQFIAQADDSFVFV